MRRTMFGHQSPVLVLWTVHQQQKQASDVLCVFFADSHDAVIYTVTLCAI